MQGPSSSYVVHLQAGKTSKECVGSPVPGGFPHCHRYIRVRRQVPAMASRIERTPLCHRGTHHIKVRRTLRSSIAGNATERMEQEDFVESLTLSGIVIVEETSRAQIVAVPLKSLT